MTKPTGKRGHNLTPEQASKIGKLGRQASKWNLAPACVGPKALRSFKHHERLQLIKAAVIKKREAP